MFFNITICKLNTKPNFKKTSLIKTNKFSLYCKKKRKHQFQEVKFFRVTKKVPVSIHFHWKFQKTTYVANVLTYVPICFWIVLIFVPLYRWTLVSSNFRNCVLMMQVTNLFLFDTSVKLLNARCFVLWSEWNKMHPGNLNIAENFGFGTNGVITYLESF